LVGQLPRPKGRSLRERARLTRESGSHSATFVDKDSLKKGEAGTGRVIAAALSLPGLKARVPRRRMNNVSWHWYVLWIAGFLLVLLDYWQLKVRPRRLARRYARLIVDAMDPDNPPSIQSLAAMLRAHGASERDAKDLALWASTGGAAIVIAAKRKAARVS